MQISYTKSDDVWFAQMILMCFLVNFRSENCVLLGARFQMGKLYILGSVLGCSCLCSNDCGLFSSTRGAISQYSLPIERIYSIFQFCLYTNMLFLSCAVFFLMTR